MDRNATSNASTPSEDRLDPAAVCTLPADPLSERMAWIRAEILPHTLASERSPDGIAWELADAPGLAAKLDRLVALERECCSGIVFSHEASSQPGQIRFEVRGVDPQAPVFASLQPTAEEPPRLAGKLGRAAGLGTLAGLVVCCVLPVGAAALVGAAAAAPLASLDQPLVIVGVSGVFAAAAFAWQARRRTRAPAANADGSSCGSGC